MINFNKLSSDINSKNFDSIEVFTELLEKSNFYEQNKKDSNTVLHLVFSSCDKDIISIFMNRMKELGFSKEEAVELLEIKTKGGYNVIDKLLQIEESVEVTMNRVSVFLDSVKDNTKMLDAFLSAKGASGSIYEALKSDADIPDAETVEILERIQGVIGHESGKISISNFLPTIEIETKDSLERQEIYNENFAKNALVVAIKGSIFKTSIGKSKDASEDTTALSVASFLKLSTESKKVITPKAISRVNSAQNKSPLGLEISKEDLQKRVADFKVGLRDLLKKEYQDEKNVVRKGFETKLTQFCKDEVTLESFKKSHSELLSNALKKREIYFEKISSLQETKGVLLGNGKIKTPEDLEALFRFYTNVKTRLAIKTFDTKVSKIAKSIFEGKDVDIKLSLKDLKVEGVIVSKIEDFFEKGGAFESTKLSEVVDNSESEINTKSDALYAKESDSVYHSYKAVNMLAYNKDHIVWAVNEITGCSASIPKAVDLVIEIAKVTSAYEMSKYIGSPMPLASAILHSSGGVSGVAEKLLGEEHVDCYSGSYIFLDTLATSVVSGFSLCGPFVDPASKAACFVGVFAIDALASIWEPAAHSYSLFSVGMSGVAVASSDASTAIKAVESFAVGARAFHSISAITERWGSYDSYNSMETSESLSGEQGVVALGECGLFDNFTSA